MSINLKAVASCIALASVSSSIQANPINHNIVNQLANHLNMSYSVVESIGSEAKLPCAQLGGEWASCNLVNLRLENNGPEIKTNDWKIYFSNVRRILDVKNEQFKITHITGDLYSLEPSEKFKGFAQDEIIDIPYVGEFWTLFATDFMPRAYVTSGDAPPKVIKMMNSSSPTPYVAPITGDDWKRVKDDNNILATPASRFAKNSNVNFISEQEVLAGVIPTPLHLTLTDDVVSLYQGVNLHGSQLPKDMQQALVQRFEQLGVLTTGSYGINVKVKPKLIPDELQISGSYRLTITPKGATVIGFDDAGAFYGVQSLLALMTINDEKNIPTLEILDTPRFAYRGVMVDVARNFHSKEIIFKTLDQMAAYKLNKLQLHLTDDEGWRLEIPGLPELTDVGSQRGHDLSETKSLLPQLGSGPFTNTAGSGYFSKQDYMDILQYAKARGIEVIPEIDMPAHARAAVVSMEARYKKLAAKGDMIGANEYRLMDPNDTSNVTTVQFYDKRSFINPCMNSSVKFVDKVITEVQKMHQEAGVPLTTWHFGGDEAKNIKLGAGFQDVNSKDKVDWKGTINQKIEDQPYAKSPKCQELLASGAVASYEHLPSYFAEKVSEIANKKGIAQFQAWQDGLKHSKNAQAFATEKVRVNFWDPLFWRGGESAYEWSSKGYEVIVSNPDYLYFDMPHEVDPLERGYYWATRATDSRKIFAFAPENLPQNAETSVDRDGNGFTSKGVIPSQGFAGMSVQLWSETVNNDELYEYMVFPRILAAAERAWHKGSWELPYQAGVEYSQETNYVNKEALNHEWQHFANIVGQKELAKLDAAGILYRVPLPGAIINKQGVLEMNISMQGLRLEYSLDKGKSWKIYRDDDKPLVKGESVQIRAVTPDSKRFSRVTSIENKEE